MATEIRHGRRKPKAAGMKKFYYVLGVVVLAGIGFIVYSMRQKPAIATQPVDIGTKDPQALVAAARGITRGSASAPVKVLVFSDFQCPGCGHYATALEPELRKEYIDAGKVQETYYDFPLTSIHEFAFTAARAGRCAEDQGKFWEYHDVLFSRQRDWEPERGQPQPIAKLVSYAQELGLDRAKFQSCLESTQHADLVTANSQLGQQLNVAYTPTVYVDGRISDNPQIEWDVLKKDIEAALGHH